MRLLYAAGLAVLLAMSAQAQSPATNLSCATSGGNASVSIVR